MALNHLDEVADLFGLSAANRDYIISAMTTEGS